MKNNKNMNNKNMNNDKTIKNLDIVAHINTDFENENTTSTMTVTIDATEKYHSEFQKLIENKDVDIILMERSDLSKSSCIVKYISSDESFLEEIQDIIAKALYNTLFKEEEEEEEEEEEDKLPVASEVNLLSQSEFNQTLDEVFMNVTETDKLDSDSLNFMIQLDATKLLKYNTTKLLKYTRSKLENGLSSL